MSSKEKREMEKIDWYGILANRSVPSAKAVEDFNRLRRERPEEKVDLAGKDLRFGSLEMINFKDADLSRSQLDGADLSGANLDGANLTAASLNGAKFLNTSLQEANFTNVILDQANFNGADLLNAKKVPFEVRLKVVEEALEERRDLNDILRLIQSWK